MEGLFSSINMMYIFLESSLVPNTYIMKFIVGLFFLSISWISYYIKMKRAKNQNERIRYEREQKKQVLTQQGAISPLNMQQTNKTAHPNKYVCKKCGACFEGNNGSSPKFCSNCGAESEFINKL